MRKLIDAIFGFFLKRNEDKIFTTIVKAKVYPPWIAEMLVAFGKHEVRDYEWLKKWLLSDGKTLGDPRKLPWCGDAEETAMALGLPDEKLPDNPYWARNWLKFGKEIKPMQYAVGIFSRKQGGHVGNLIAQDATHYYVLGGNQGDSVNIVRIEKERLLGSRWPITTKFVPQPLPVVSANVQISKDEI